MSMFDKLKDQVANAGEKLKEEIQKAQEQQKEKRVQSEADRNAWNGRFEKIKEPGPFNTNLKTVAR